MQAMLTSDINSIENPLSMKIPKIAVPKAVEKTINAVVKALILPKNLTPQISAHVDDPKTLDRPFDMPIKPKNKKADYLKSQIYKITKPNNKDIFKQ